MLIRLATASVNQTPLDWKGNRTRILQAAQVAMEGGPEAILFPELCISGYGCEDAFHMPEVWSRSRQSLDILCEKLAGIAGTVPVIVGLPYMHQGLLYNVAAVIHSGSVTAIVPKQHLAGDGIHYEPRWFHPFKSGPDHTGPEGLPFGPTIFDTGRFRFIVEICEDSWVDNRPASQHAGSSYDAILSPTASHFSIGKQRIRRQIALESSRAFHCAYVSVNLLGNEAGRAIYDGQTLACQNGNLILESPAFSFQPYTVSQIAFDPEANRSKRVQTHSFRESISIPPGGVLESATVRLETHFKKEFGFRLPEEDRANPTAGNNQVGFGRGEPQSGSLKPEPRPESQNRPGIGFATPERDVADSLSNDANSATQSSSGSKPSGENASGTGGGSNIAIPGLVSEKRHGSAYLEFLYATSLALFDYLRKSRSRGFALSLSGGADSAACAVLVERMIRLGIAELGLAGFLKAIHREDLLEAPTLRGDDLSDSRTAGQAPNGSNRSSASDCTPDNSSSADPALDRPESLVRELLFTVYQGTAQSSDTTRNAAYGIATALGANHQQVSVQSIVENYVETYEQSYARKLTWAADDLVLQNIQARARSPFVWMLANATGSLLIATGNRSEGAVGYCTMDGDTSGGIAPIAGIDKHFLRRWLLFMEQTGDPHFGPIPALKAINEQQPTAELRPGDQNQTDESDLMAYDLLNRIQKLAVRDRFGPEQILERLVRDCDLPREDSMLRPSIPGSEPQVPNAKTYRPFAGDYSREQLIQAIKKYFTLWSRNQWKRERIAVSFHLDDENIDPRTYFRFPILSAGFIEELEELE